MTERASWIDRNIHFRKPKEYRKINRKAWAYSFAAGAVLPVTTGIVASFVTRFSVGEVWKGTAVAAGFMGFVAVSLAKNSVFDHLSLRAEKKNPQHIRKSSN